MTRAPATRLATHVLVIKENHHSAMYEPDQVELLT